MAEPSTPAQSGDAVGRRTFSTSFRGFDQTEVRAYLDVLAGQFKALQARVAELEEELEDAQAAPLPVTPIVDVASITNALGEETARVLRTAQEAAEDLRTRAEEGAARALKEAHDAAVTIRAAAEAVLGERTLEAEEAASRIRRESEDEAARLRREAANEAESTVSGAIQQGKDMLAQAQAARERVLSDLSRRRKLALTQLEQLRAGRQRLESSLEAARAEITTMMDDLGRSDEEARRAAETVGRQTSKAATAAATAAVQTDPEEASSAVSPAEEPDPGPSDPAAQTEPAAPDRGEPEPEEPEPIPAGVAGAVPPDAPAEEGASAAGPVAPDVAPAGENPGSDAPIDHAGVRLSGVHQAAPAADPMEAGGRPAPKIPPPPPPISPEPQVSPASVVAEGRSRATGVEVDPDALVEAEAVEARSAEEEEQGSPAADDAEAAAAAADPALSAPGDAEVAAADPAPPARDDAEVAAADPAPPAPGDAEVAAADPAPAAADHAEVAAAAPATPAPGDAVVAAADPALAAADHAEVAAAPAGRKQPPARKRYRHDAVPAATLPEAAVGAAAPAESGGKVDTIFARIRADRATEVTPAKAVLTEPEPAPERAGARSSRPAPAVEEARPPSEDAGLEAPRSDADESFLQRRDALLERALATAAKSLKRALADDHNVALDRLRTLRTAPATVESLLGEEQAQVEAFARSVTPGLVDAATAGARMAKPDDTAAPDPALVGPMASSLALEIVGGLRLQIAAVLDGAGGDKGARTVDDLNGAYRERRGRVERAVGDATTAAAAAGFAASLEPGTLVRWVVEDVDGPCPDCDDNALAGPTPLGSPFPTGQLAPPAHSGCRCVLAQTAM